MKHEHEHEHPQDHAHPHPEEHEHPEGHAHHHHAASTRPELPRGAGAGKILFLDAPSGLAGDMIVAALVDLGVPEVVVANAVAALPISGFHLHFGTRVRSGVVAGSFDVHVDEAQPPRDYAEVCRVLDASTLAPAVRALAHATFARLADAEAKVHRMPRDEVHFHEVGSVDAIVDVVGSAAALEHLGAELVVSPLPMGRGFVKAGHGVLPLPAPATVECLRGFPTYDAGIEFEFVTPTGAAIVGAHARTASRWPSFAPDAVGWGAGTANLRDRPNLLRAVLGTPSIDPAVLGAREPPGTHVVIEANVDDATGELVANAIEVLLAAGALDAWATPITMKKGRPSLTVSALTDVARADVVATAMLRETTSIGIRRYAVARVERPRRSVEVVTPYGLIPVKIAEGPYGPPQVKPEFDACLAAARAHDVPVREVLRAAVLAAVNPGS
jgi:pyridinium-3,5-bisthiocarboxylic acid mononucleotide nickel chelatase